MDDIKVNTHRFLSQIYYTGIKPLIVEKDNYAYIRDPIFNISRNRVIAEVVKSMIRSQLEPDGTLIEKLCNFLLKKQNRDGSWNEIHPNYNQPSALVSSIIGEALLLMYEKCGETKFEESILRTKNYVLSQYKSRGYFIKSKSYTADHLNVDAVCGGFLALYDKIFGDDYCIEIAKQTAKHVCNHQFSSGCFPYAVNQGNYSYALTIPCIHYQGVTMYYLIKINKILNEQFIQESLLKGGDWLLSIQKDNGKFDWSYSGLMFAYYLSGAYAFCFASLLYISKWQKKYAENGYKCLKILEQHNKGLILRWENDSWISFPVSLFTTVKTSKIGNFPVKQKLFRFGYGLYRQMARRRFSIYLDDTLFINLTNFFKIKSSTIEPFSNYGDLFMSSEVLDCLSSITGG